jgi:ferric-dicitrate binding protein FerR (iron transport regulator)
MRDLHANAVNDFERLGMLLRAATPTASLQQHLEGRARVIAAVEKMRRPAPRASRVRPLAIFASATAATAAVLSFVHTRGPANIEWHVEGGAVGAQGYVSIPPAAPTARLVFDDGSHVSLSPGSRSRVAATTPVGAEVVLEQGRARVHVAHHERTSWLVDAGPFAVRVTGTEFLVAWAAESEMLDVWMTSGRVVVKGPVLGDAQPLSAGQHLRARLRDGAVQIDSAPEPPDASAVPVGGGAPAPASSEGALAPSAVEAGSTNSAPAPGPFGVASTPAPTWSRLVAAGDFARILREAEAEGIAHAVAARPLADLRALGDAARYLGNGAVARRAFLGVRARYASSPEARTAAFLLGRLAEEQDLAPEQAGRWYDTYLAEAPGGELAGNALGRKMLIVAKLHGRDAARSLADRYLQRFPSGPYAAAARDLAP